MRLVDVIHGKVTETSMRLCSMGETRRTSVPETTVEFVHSVRLGVEPIAQIATVCQGSYLPAIMSMTNARQGPTVLEGRVVAGSLLFCQTLFIRHALFDLLTEQMILPVSYTHLTLPTKLEV